MLVCWPLEDVIEDALLSVPQQVELVDEDDNGLTFLGRGRSRLGEPGLQ